MTVGNKSQTNSHHFEFGKRRGIDGSRLVTSYRNKLNSHHFEFGTFNKNP
jgi:hypothetical protein